jgi:SAM-dependent methyltransferase
MEVDASSLERLVPDEVARGDATGNETLRLHVERYRFAARNARPGRLLDIACGVGYGTRLLADECPDVSAALGVDLSESAVAYAQRRYGRAGVSFRIDDALRFHDPDRFDTIVSLETIEHVREPRCLVDRLVTMLRPGGVLVASVPTTPSVDMNPHHLHDFSESSFRRMFAAHSLEEEACMRQVQSFGLLRVLGRREQRAVDLRSNLLGYYAAHPKALLRRLGSILRFGFTNRYVTVAWRASER